MSDSRNKNKSAKQECSLNANPAQKRRANAKAAQIASAFPAGLAAPALRALASAEITNLDQLTDIREEELQELHGMGPKAINTLRQALAAKGQLFRT